MQRRDHEKTEALLTQAKESSKALERPGQILL